MPLQNVLLIPNVQKLFTTTTGLDLVSFFTQNTEINSLQSVYFYCCKMFLFFFWQMATNN